MRKLMGHTAVSATQASSVTLYGAKENYSKFEIFKMIVNTKTKTSNSLEPSLLSSL